jgi:hypothetical protein
MDTFMFGYGSMMGPYGPGVMMNPYGYGGYGYGGMFIGLLFWIVIIVLAYFLIKSLIGVSPTFPTKPL